MGKRHDRIGKVAKYFLLTFLALIAISSRAAFATSNAPQSNSSHDETTEDAPPANELKGDNRNVPEEQSNDRKAATQSVSTDNPGAYHRHYPERLRAASQGLSSVSGAIGTGFGSQAGVDLFNGSFTYSVPISTPPGRNNIGLYRPRFLRHHLSIKRPS